MAYFLNRENQFKIGDNTLAAGVYQWSDSVTEDTDESTYYDGDDEYTVLAVHRVLSFSCHTKKTGSETATMDAAQAAIWAMRDKTGADRNTTLTYTDIESGTSVIWDVTISDIVAAGGDATGKAGFSFSVHLNKVHSA